MSTLAQRFQKTRADFPILQEKIHGKPLVYLDSAASSQHPLEVIDAIRDYYLHSHANVHRGAHLLSQKATDLYEMARAQVAEFVGAPDPEELIFTRGTTESINLVAQCWGLKNVKAGDDVVVTRMEHHSNFVPWQLLAQKTGARFRIVELDAHHRVDLRDLREALGGKPKVFAVAHMSNTLGVVNPVKEMIQMAHEAGALVVVDAAQSVPHMPVDVKDLDADFVAFSAHKMCGPTGIGALWGRKKLLKAMDPYQVGGGMIGRVGDQETTWAGLPYKFEAGTPHMAGAVGFAAAVRYLNRLGIQEIYDYEKELAQKALEALGELDFVKIIGPTDLQNRGAVVSFSVDGIHPHDLATFLDVQGVAVRSGHHCAQPLMASLKQVATCRASFYFYNTPEEVTALVTALRQAKDYFHSR